MSANQVFRLYAQRIGVGAMAGAGFIGIVRALPTIVRAFSLGFKQIVSPHAAAQQVPRTDRDLKMSTVLIGIAAVRGRDRRLLLRPAEPGRPRGRGPRPRRSR